MVSTLGGFGDHRVEGKKADPEKLISHTFCSMGNLKKYDKKYKRDYY